MIEAKYYVYLWRLKDTKEVIYVGKGSGNRWKSMKDRNPTFKELRKNEECECEIVKYFENEEEAYEYEKELGVYYKALGQCNGCHSFGKKGKYLDNETLEKMKPTMFQKGHKRSWNKGLKMNAEFREKCRKRLLGTKQSEETKKKRSESLKGHEVKNETREKIRKARSIPILEIDAETNEITKRYESSKELAHEKSVSYATVSLWLKNKTEKQGKYYIKENQYGNPESV